MTEMLKGLLGWRCIAAALLICLAPAAFAGTDTPKAESGASGAPSDARAPEEGAPEDAGQDASDKDTSDKDASDKDASDKDATDKDSAGKAVEDKGNDESGGPGENNERKGSVRLKDLVGDGYLIRTTVFVPADAVTRQTGTVSTDAMVLTLQKETAIAICYYTFKAYVKGGKGLMKIPSCTVFD